MVQPSLALSTSEHWLTAMTCTVCEETPDTSPLYICNMGHVICNICFGSMNVKGSKGVTRCVKCGAVQFKARRVSQDFLHKLKTKPGIGRPRRYELKRPKTPSDYGDSEFVDARDETITMEKLFRLSTDQLEHLFENTPKKPELSLGYTGIKYMENNDARIDEKKVWLSQLRKYRLPNLECSSSVSLSRKPLTCPHDPCNKVIAISSFNSHFKYEHNDIPRFSCQRGHELHLICDPCAIEYKSSFCLGLITVYEKIDVMPLNSNDWVARKFSQKVPIDTFWLMVSASPQEKRCKEFTLFWLFTNTQEFYNCTIEVASQKEGTCCSTFCGMNCMHESQDTSDVAKRLNCLYLSYGTLQSMLEDGPKLNLRITVH